MARDGTAVIRSSHRVELPVRVGRKGRIGRATANAAQMRTQLDKNPKLRDRVRADNKGAALAWAEAVRVGNLSREEFERHLVMEVDHGRMDPADAEAARATLDGA